MTFELSLFGVFSIIELVRAPYCGAPILLVLGIQSPGDPTHLLNFPQNAEIRAGGFPFGRVGCAAFSVTSWSQLDMLSDDRDSESCLKLRGDILACNMVFMFKCLQFYLVLLFASGQDFG